MDSSMNQTKQAAASAVAANASSSCAFLQLPAELRNIIYELAVLKNHRILTTLDQIPDIPDDIQPPLTQTCRQIREECLPIYYEQNVFVYGRRNEPSERPWRVQHLRRMRNIDLHVEGYDFGVHLLTPHSISTVRFGFYSIKPLGEVGENDSTYHLEGLNNASFARQFLDYGVSKIGPDAPLTGRIIDQLFLVLLTPAECSFLARRPFFDDPDDYESDEAAVTGLAVAFDT